MGRCEGIKSEAVVVCVGEDVQRSLGVRQKVLQMKTSGDEGKDGYRDSCIKIGCGDGGSVVDLKETNLRYQEQTVEVGYVRWIIGMLRLSSPA